MASLPSDNTKSRQILGANYEIRQYINFVWQGLGLGPDKDEAVLCDYLIWFVNQKQPPYGLQKYI